MHASLMVMLWGVGPDSMFKICYFYTNEYRQTRKPLRKDWFFLKKMIINVIMMIFLMIWTLLWSESQIFKHPCAFQTLIFIEDVLIVEIVDYHQVVWGQILEIYECSFELSGHLVVKVYLGLWNTGHALHSSVVSEFQHEFSLLHLLSDSFLLFIILPHSPNALSYEKTCCLS